MASSPKPLYEVGPHRLYHCRMEELLASPAAYDALVTDPPYGIGAAEDERRCGESRGKVRKKGLANRRTVTAYPDVPTDWDNAPASPAQLALMRGACRHQIIFGGNYFALPPARCWLVWDKQNGDNDYADCEMAWTNLDRAVRLKRWLWHGMLRHEKGKRVHPTQKPVQVMRWCLSMLPKGVVTVLDPFMGSGSTGVACALDNLKLGRGYRFVGCDARREYVDIARDRIAGVAGGRLPAVGEGLLGGLA